MQTATSTRPILPTPLRLPAALIPPRIHARIAVGLLTRVFGAALREGELDFLEGHSVQVEALDGGIRFAFGMENGHLVTRPTEGPHDLILRGQVYDFLLLASRREDADTLFFQRRLKMEGSTDLGLEVKNFLDAFDLTDLPFHQQLIGGLNGVSRVYERLF